LKSVVCLELMRLRMEYAQMVSHTIGTRQVVLDE
jgi:hypothetical protein